MCKIRSADFQCSNQRIKGNKSKSKEIKLLKEVPPTEAWPTRSKAPFSSIFFNILRYSSIFFHFLPSISSFPWTFKETSLNDWLGIHIATKAHRLAAFQVLKDRKKEIGMYSNLQLKKLFFFLVFGSIEHQSTVIPVGQLSITFRSFTNSIHFLTLRNELNRHDSMFICPMFGTTLTVRYYSLYLSLPIDYIIIPTYLNTSSSYTQWEYSENRN